MSHDPQTKHPASDSLQGADYETGAFPLSNTADVQEIQADGAFSRLKHIGFNPIPIVRGGKKPMANWKPNQTTRATDAECAAWDAGTYNIGIVTGAISGVFVVDVDGAVGEATLAALEAEYGALPDTVRAKSGKGWHYYFPYPIDGRVIRNLAGQSVHGEVLQGLDIRGEGGYIVAPPSLHEYGMLYQWENSPFDMSPAPAPDWLLELVVQPAKPVYIPPSPTKNQDNSAYVQAALEGELDTLRTAEEGQRNNALNKAAYSLGQLIAHGLDAGQIASELMQVASAIGLSGQEAVNTISSGIEAGVKTPRILPTTPPLPAKRNHPNAPWQAPVRFDDITTPPIPPQLLPEPLCAFVQAVALATETPAEMAIACALAVVSVAVTGKYEVSPRAGWKESLNTYWFVELPPANRKSTVVNSFTAPLITWEMEQANLIKPEIAKAKSLQQSQLKLIEKMRKQAVDEKDSLKREGLMKEVADMDAALDANPLPTLPRLFSNNVTPESLENETNDQGGVFAVISDEGGVVETLTGLYTNGKANTDIILKGIDGGEMRVKRKDRDIQMKPYLTFLLVVQPRIREKMSENPAMQGNGALERFLYLIPKSTIGYRTHTTPPIPPALKQAYDQLIDGLLALPFPENEKGERVPESLTFDMEGQHAMLAFQHWLEPQLKKGGACYALQGWGGKIAGFTARIAGLLHLVETQGRTLTIPLATVENAIILGKGLLEHAKATFALMKLDGVVRDASEISLWITDTAQSSFTRTELTNAMRHNAIDAKRLDAAMSELEARHIIRTRQEKGKGTKPVTVYDVNPAYLIHTA